MTIARSTRIASRRFRLGGALLTLALATASALAQDVLPRPAEPFAGKIGTTYAPPRHFPHRSRRRRERPTSCWS